MLTLTQAHASTFVSLSRHVRTLGTSVPEPISRATSISVLDKTGAEELLDYLGANGPA
jgi:hypothetical protein